MKGTDKFLMGIVAGVLVLVGAVSAMALLRANRPTYQPDGTPEGVAHNYLLALQREEYDRAYGYLSHSLAGLPQNVEAFERSIEANRWSFDSYSGDVSLAIEGVEGSGDRVKVIVRQTTFRRGGLFSSGQYSTAFEMSLRRERGMWTVAGSERYWAACWTWAEGCR